MFGQFGHFYKSAQVKLPYAIERYANETKRLLRVLDHQLDGYQVMQGVVRDNGGFGMIYFW